MNKQSYIVYNPPCVIPSVRTVMHEPEAPRVYDPRPNGLSASTNVEVDLEQPPEYTPVDLGTPSPGGSMRLSPRSKMSSVCHAFSGCLMCGIALVTIVRYLC
jgi:hypothetical protein